ncbi:glutathione S-transferase family protein [Ancylobacter sp. A5.8]|uniref:glutathione S-transferase family protein n=1 Tax=Ancylobacter gelatini TaxID=2919920 RepID=UPI001F4E301E|nr:glutathione S-transferase family protein [Ancylobacter gelatini]MCJ8142687.1 glutathione S-transferase family protein [Ancylobacter gelatini]
MLTLFDMPDSGNSYKVRLAAAHLGVPLMRVTMSSRDGSTRAPDFLARNPIGKLPTLGLEDGRYLAESNAIMLFLAEGRDEAGIRLMPADSYDRAKMYEWLFFEQYSHEPAIAVRRALFIYEERRALATPERLVQLLDAGNRALTVMESRLSAHDWLAGDALSLADIALYAYTHTAEEGGYDLGGYTGITAWLSRMAAQPGHVALTD